MSKYSTWQEALNKSGSVFTLKFDPPIANQNEKSKRQRKISWFNPPFSRNVRTNVGEQFLKLIDKNFPKTHPLGKLIERNTVKISYRCMPNITWQAALIKKPSTKVDTTSPLSSTHPLPTKMRNPEDNEKYHGLIPPFPEMCVQMLVNNS